MILTCFTEEAKISLDPDFLATQVLRVWKQWPLEDRVPAEHLVSRYFCC